MRSLHSDFAESSELIPELFSPNLF